MQWKNKGHEFDHIGKMFERIDTIYLWGAGITGEKIAKTFLKFNLDIIFVDINPLVEWKRIYDREYKVEPLKKILDIQKENSLLLICLKESSLDNAILTATNARWILQKNLFNAVDFCNEFLSLFLLYNSNILYAGLKDVLTLSFNEKCTLNCKNCNASIPYIREPMNVPVENVISDADILFNRFDYIEILRIGGAETLMYKDIDKIVTYIHKNYNNKYGCMELTTNGTISVEENTLDLFTKCRVRVCISDYSNQFPKFKDMHLKLISKLEKAQTMYSYLQDMEWVDFGFNTTEIKAIGDYTLWHDCCAHPCKDYRNGIIYGCSQAYWAKRRYPEYSDSCDELNIKKCDDKKIIYEYLKGYNERGYLLPCIICNGHTNLNRNIIPVAEQLRR
mgnify:CR=1 FL=1